MKRTTIVAPVLVACAVLLGGCGGTEVSQTTVSKGQELTDLKKALDSGAINQKEYDRLRAEIMRR